MNQQQPLRQRFIYHGRVQGVGFRYTVSSIAKHLPVVGYVKNLPNGTVEVVAEGTEETLQEFRDRIEAAFPRNISDCVVEDEPGSEEFTQFRIRY